MCLVTSLIFSHLRPKPGALDLNMKSGVILLFLLVEVCISCYHAVEGTPIRPNYEVENREQKKSHLYHIYSVYENLENQGYIDPSLGVAKYETMKYALMGSISSIMNYQCTPRHLMNIKDHVIEKMDKDGSFSVYVYVNSLADGNMYYHLEGEIDMDSLKVHIEYHKQLSELQYQVAKASTPASFFHSLYKTSSFNNGSKDIDVLTKLCENTQCLNGSKGICKRGEVVMDTWVNTSLAFQRQLARDVPINYVQWIGSHNSFNNKADGYGSGETLIEKLLKIVTFGKKQKFVWAQQYFTITDQLNMGSRYFMLNPVYVWDAMRLCHGGINSPWFDKVIQYLEKVLHKTIKFDSGDLGCLPTDRHYSAAVQELHDWLMQPGHEEEVIVLMIDDYGADKDWGRQDLIWGPITDTLGDLVFTQSTKKACCPDFWPSQNKLVSMGKRVVILGTDRVMNDYVFLDMTTPTWDQDTMKYFTPYPTCQGYKPGSWFVQGGESQVVGAIYNGPKEEGLIAPANFQQVLQCPVTIFKLDLVSPGLLNSSIWSWQEKFSAASLTSGMCAVMKQGLAGRWTVTNCNSTLCYHVCTNTTNVLLDSSMSAWNSPSCPGGYTTGCPIEGYQNWQIYSALGGLTSSSGDLMCAWLDLANVT